MICNECETVAHCTSHGCIPKQKAVDRLLDEAKLLADARPVEVGHLPEWTLDAEHMIRRLVKALAEQPAQQEPTCKQDLQVWVQRTGQFSWEPQDERFWTRLTSPPAQQEPVAWVREHELPLAPGDAFSWVETFVHKTPLYTSPPAQQEPENPDEVGTGCECANCANGMGECQQEPVAFWKG